MITPVDREALIAAVSKFSGEDRGLFLSKVEVRGLLAAIEAVGCHVSPNKPTEDMLSATARVRRAQDRAGNDDWEITHPDTRRRYRNWLRPQLTAGLAASPYRKDGA